MAYFSLHAYDADVWLQEFKGLNQIDESLNTDIRYATEASNVETPHGVLQPNAGYDLMDGEFEARVETLAKFHRRWYEGSGSKDWLICASGGKLYVRQSGSNIGWIQISMPNTIESFECNTWSWVTYEQNVVAGVTVDVLLISNAVDGMFMVVPPDRPSTWGDAISNELIWDNPNLETWEDDYSPKWTIIPIDTRANPEDETEEPKKFGVIERYAERIWGGAVAGEPDMLVYSRPYDPTDWTPAGEDEEPEDGAGEILQPSWDGDSFTALRSFGNQLLAFKKNRVWRVSGTDPGEYVFYEQFGGGAAYPNTIAVDVERIMMASRDGMSIYDGMSVSEYAREQIAGIWRTVNRDALDQMCGALFRNRYYLAIPVNGSTVNNALLVFNNDERTILYYDDLSIESLLPTDDALYATSSSLPGQVLIVNYDSWLCGKSSGAASRWVSPWMDFGYKRIQKGGFDMYIMPEVQEEAVTLRISIQTEKKTKTKNYTIARTAKEHRGKRIHFGGTGRRFRIIIETEAGNRAPWRLIGGIQLVVETDPD